MFLLPSPCQHPPTHPPTHLEDSLHPPAARCVLWVKAARQRSIDQGYATIRHSKPHQRPLSSGGLSPPRRAVRLQTVTDTRHRHRHAMCVPQVSTHTETEPDRGKAVGGCVSSWLMVSTRQKCQWQSGSRRHRCTAARPQKSPPHPTRLRHYDTTFQTHTDTHTS